LVLQNKAGITILMLSNYKLIRVLFENVLQTILQSRL
jgi:hypothetical protein